MGELEFQEMARFRRHGIFAIRNAWRSGGVSDDALSTNRTPRGLRPDRWLVPRCAGVVGRASYLAAICIALAGVVGVTPERADAANVDSQGAITLSPAVVDRSVAAGTVTEQRVTIGNSTSERRVIEVRFQDIHDSGRQDGTYAATPPGTSPHGAGSWLSIPVSSVILEPGERRVLRVSINVPADAAGGSALAAMVVRVRPTASSTVAVSTDITQLVLLTVQGPEAHGGLRISASPTSKFREHSPLAWELRLRNTGNTHLLLHGKVHLHGWGIDQRTSIHSLVLFPGAERRIPVQLGVADRPSRITFDAQMHDARGDGRAWSATAAPVWLIPWWSAAAIAALLAGLIWRILVIRRANAVLWYPDDGSDGLSEE